MNAAATNAGGWEQCLFRTGTLRTFRALLPDDFAQVIASVSKESAVGSADNLVRTTDDLFLLSHTEIGGYAAYSIVEGTAYTFFSMQSSFRAFGVRHWVRTARYDNNTMFGCIGEDGRSDGYMYAAANNTYAVLLAMCL